MKKRAGIRLSFEMLEKILKDNYFFQLRQIDTSVDTLDSSKVEIVTACVNQDN